MRRIVMLLFGLCLSIALLTACGNNDNDGRPEMKMKYKQDIPLRNDPEYNDRDNRVFDSDRDDRFIDDEDIRLTPRGMPRGNQNMAPNYNR
ncbi:hypothetical protein [Paenibacillus sp. BC26]|uniref:hypothetical protein n=1 Tax=Paenibacillus sp. BC26 TaxID=1881032 RepID=UPI00116039AB|nr:hypothetical protein [Paenibacillus sp. BC26]